MGIINKVSGQGFTNFRKGGSFDPGKWRYYFFHRKEVDFLTTAQLATMQSTLQTAMETATEKSRFFFVGEFLKMTNNGEGVAYQTVEQHKKRSDKGTIDIIQTLNGSWAEYQKLTKLLKYLGKNYKVVPVDENFVIYHNVTATGICGFTPHELHTLPITWPIQGQAAEYMARVALKNIDEIDNCYHTELGFDPTTLTAVEDVTLSSFTSGTAGTLNVAIEAVEGEENYAELYQGTSELRQTSLFTAVDASGGAITISSLALVMDGTKVKGFAFAMDTSDPQYVVGQPLYLKIASTTGTKTATGVAMQSNTLQITMT